MRAVKKHLFPMLGILLVAAAFRLIDLQGVPPGLQHDEVFYAHDALTIRQGEFRLFYADNQGREPLFIYLLALTTGTMGEHAIAIRLPAVFSGLLAIALMFRWAHTLFGARIALTAAALTAVGFWPVWLSRAGLRVATLIPFVALFGWLFSQAIKNSLLRKPSLRWFAAAGLALGLSFYTYAAAYVLPIVFTGYIVYLLLFRIDVFNQQWRGLLTTVSVAALLFLPLALTIASEGYTRAGNTSTALTAIQVNGDFGPLREGLFAVFTMFTTTGDPQWRYNLSGRPVFSVLPGAFFVAGLGIIAFFMLRAIVRSIRRRMPNSPLIAPGRADSPFWALLIIWFFVGLLPSALTDQPPSFLRTTATLPVVFMFAAIGVEGLRRGIVALPSARDALPFWPVVILVIVGISGFNTARDYFDTWATHPEVQRIYRADLAEVAVLLRTLIDEPPAVAISTTEPNNLDPFVFAYTPHGDNEIHWFDGANSLMLPAQGGDLYYTLEPQPNPVAEELLASFDASEPPTTQYLTQIELPPADEAFSQMALTPAQGIFIAEPLAFDPRDPDRIRTELTTPVQFGEAVELLHYTMPTEAPPNDWFRLQMTFRVRADVNEPQPWSLFVHFLDENGNLAANRDFLGVPSFTWREGDIFIQFHDVPLPPDLAHGYYHVQIGFYSLADGVRFPIMVDGEPAADRLLLEPVQVIDTPQ